MPIINPFALLWKAAQKPGFAALLIWRLDVEPNSWERPWGLILYSDEVSPGNQLAHHNARKSWAIYWSLLQLGLAALSDEDGWFCTAAERSDNLKKVVGGIGQVFTKLLKYMFASHGHTLQHAGVLLDLYGGRSVRVFIKLAMVIQDGAAHKFVYFLKGDAGTRFCVECRTVIADKSGHRDEEANEDLLKINFVRKCELQNDFATNAEVRGTVHRLSICPPAELALREQACGFVHNRFSMLLDPSLNDVVHPITQKAFDWMHCFFVHGVWNTVLILVLQALVHGGVPTAAQDLHEYILLWALPGRLGGERGSKRLAEPFTKSRWTSAKKKAGYIKCQASDALSMFGIVCHWLYSVFFELGFAPWRWNVTCSCVTSLTSYSRSPMATSLARTSMTQWTHSCRKRWPRLGTVTLARNGTGWFTSVTSFAASDVCCRAGCMSVSTEL